MSAEEVKLLERVVERFNEGGIEAALGFYAEDVEWHTDPKWPADRVYRGRDGIRRLGRLWLQSFDEHRWEIERVIDLDQRLVQLVTLRARSTGEEDWVEQPIGMVVVVRDGKIAYVQSWLSWDQALAAAGVALE